MANTFLFHLQLGAIGCHMSRVADPASLSAAEEGEEGGEDDDFPPLDKVVPSAAGTAP